jgi:hypothetical protein
MSQASRNPYSPPTAAVTTAPSAPVPRVPAPWSVWCGVWLYILSFVLYLVLDRTIAPVRPTETLATPVIHGPLAMVTGVAVVVLIFGAPAWLLFKVTRRHNWARITLSLVSALGFALFSPYLFQVLASHPADVAPVFANEALEVVALVLLFTPSANQWFKSAPED